MSEDEFRDRLFTELAENPGPPLGGLVADATAAGVKLRRRNRIVQTVAGGIGHGGTPTSAAAGSNTPAAPTAAASTSAANTDAKTGQPAKGPDAAKAATTPLVRNWQTVPAWMTVPAATAQPDGGKAVTPEAAAALLEELVTATGGPGSFTHVFAQAGDVAVGSSSNTGTGYSADVFWNHGTVNVQYMGKQLYNLGCDPSETVNGNVCYDYKLADGTEVNYFQLTGTAGATEVKAQKGQANLLINRPDGAQVLVLEVNGPQTGSTGPTRADEPLTEQQLWQIASDPRWAPTMAADFVAHAAHTIQLESEPF